MRACDHPDYQAEDRYLSGVLAAVDRSRETVIVTGFSGGADGPATALRRGRTPEQLGLGRISTSPYFARVDHAAEGFYSRSSRERPAPARPSWRSTAWPTSYSV